MEGSETNLAIYDNDAHSTVPYHSSRVPHADEGTNADAHDARYLRTLDEQRQTDTTDAAVISEALAWIPSQPPPQKFPALARPVAIPQIQPNSYRSGPMPYCRAYAPALAQNAVSCADFVAFIDNLAIAQAPAAPFKALQLAGTGVGFVPHHWAQAASAGIGMAAGVGSAAVSVTRVKLYLKKVNEQYFVPRGLQATVSDDEELRAIVRADPIIHPLAPLGESSHVLTLAERRIKALDQYISPLDFNVPAPKEQVNVLDRLAAKQIQGSIKKNREKAIKEAHKQGLGLPDADVSPRCQSEEYLTTGDLTETSEEDMRSNSRAIGWQSSSTQDPEQDAKIQELQLRIQEITIKADRQMLSETRDKRKTKIEKDKAKEIAKVQAKIEKRLKTLNEAEKDCSLEDGSDKDRRTSKKHKDSKKDTRQREKDAEKSAKLKWIVIDNVKTPHHTGVAL